jgi:polyhydroxyalkanoate synthesis regulator phasin
MWVDEIVEETRKAREEYSAKFNYDLEAMYEDLKEQEKQGQRKVISLAPKEPEVIPQAKAS